jgi:hypothetical protein
MANTEGCITLGFDCCSSGINDFVSENASIQRSYGALAAAAPSSKLDASSAQWEMVPGRFVPNVYPRVNPCVFIVESPAVAGWDSFSSLGVSLKRLLGRL